MLTPIIFRKTAGGCMARQSKSGFTLVELLVVIAIIGVLIALAFAAVQQAREAARRNECISKLKQLGIACHSYEGAYKTFPPGGTLKGHSFLVSLLPYVEQTPLYKQLDFSLSPGKPPNKFLQSIEIEAYRCPSDSGALLFAGEEAANYAGNFGTGVQKYGYNGTFQHALDGVVRLSHVTDGLSQTVAISEVLPGSEDKERRRFLFTTPLLDQPDQLAAFAAACESMQMGAPGADPYWRGHPWTQGIAGLALYNHVLPPNSNSCTNDGQVNLGALSAASFHPGGVNVLSADGAVDFVGDAIDPQTWKSLGSRNGRDLP